MSYASPVSLAPPSFARLDDPRLGPPAEPDIRIIGPRSIDVDAPLVLCGRFAITEPEHVARSRTPHRDLVLSVHREPFYACVHPFRDCLVFADDVHAANGLIVGWFSFDVWSRCSFRLEGRYYLRVSLGTMISPACEVAVGLPVS